MENERYLARIMIDKKPVEIKTLHYEDAIKKIKEISLDNFFEHCVGETEIIRIKDGFEMYSSKHDYVLQSYELMSPEDWNTRTYLFRSEMSPETPRVYFDVDGTLGKFYPDGKGLAYPEQILDPQYNYFRNIEPHQFMIDLAKSLHESGTKVCILSATDRMCFVQRFEWIKEHLPFVKESDIYFCPIGSDKSKFCTCSERSILIDDYNLNGEQWQGKFIKCVNSINSQSEDYDNILTDLAENEFSKTDYISYLKEMTSFINDELKSLIHENDKIAIANVDEFPDKKTVWFELSDNIRNQIEKDIHFAHEESIPSDFDVYANFYNDASFDLNVYYITGTDDIALNITSIISTEILDRLQDCYNKTFIKERTDKERQT